MQKEIKVVSFDIFDTLLLRLTSSPEDVFSIMYGENRECLEKYFSRNKWIEFRKQMEQMARGKAREVNIFDIYRQGEAVFPWVEELVEKEFICECMVCFLNPRIIESMEKLIRDGKKLILISDMYWPHDHIKRLLESCGFDIGLLEKIYVSCEYGVSKYSGELYDVILEEQGLRPDEWVHIGDNDHSDYRQARSRKIAAGLYGLVSYADVNYPFLNLENCLRDRVNLLPVRLLAGDAAHGGYDSWHTIGAMVYGPLIAGAAEYVADTAQKEGILQIFPLMREGYFLAKVLRVIAQHRGLELEIKELYVSRSALKKAVESKEDGDKTIQYFRQMGLEKPFITFDVGYGGTIGAYIDELLEQYGIGSRGIHCLAIEQRKAVGNILGGHDIRGYVNAEEKQEWRKLCNWIFEMSFMPGNGTTTGYEKKGNKVVPELKETDYSKRQMRDALDCQSGILHFAEIYCLIKKRKPFLRIDAADSYDILKRLFCSPVSAETFCIGDMEYDENQGDFFKWKVFDGNVVRQFRKKGFSSFEFAKDKRKAEWIAGMQTLCSPLYFYKMHLHLSLEYEELECLKRLEDYLEKIGDSRFLLTGFGMWGKRLLKYLAVADRIWQVEAIIDNNRDIQGLQICGKEVRGIRNKFVSARYLITVQNREGIGTLEQQIKSAAGNDVNIDAIWDSE